MAVIALPTDLRIASMNWGIQRKDVSFSSSFGSQSTAISAPIWSVSIGINAQSDYQSGAWQSLLLQLRGQTNQIAVHNVARPVPLGTLRGNIELFSSAGSGATSAIITAPGQGVKTLKRGDYLGVGQGITQQVVMVVQDMSMNGVGQGTVVFEPPLRSTHLAATPLVWNKPTALFRATQKDFGWQYSTVFVSGITLDLIEDVRP